MTSYNFIVAQDMEGGKMYKLRSKNFMFDPKDENGEQLWWSPHLIIHKPVLLF